MTECVMALQSNMAAKIHKFVSDVFYMLLKSTLWAQYDPIIGMFRSNCLKVYGMSIIYQVLLSKSVWNVSISPEYIVL